MRAIWKGAVAFGLVNVPVRLYSATGEHEVTLHQVHREDGGRIRYRKVCSIDGEPVEMADIAKGYETDDGELVVLTDEDLRNLPLSTEREIEVLEFVPAEQVDPILLGRTYYLEPDKAAAKPYALLRGALEESDRMAVVKVALRQRESMAVLRVRDRVICMQTLLWPDEIRAADFPVLDEDVTVKPAEQKMASSLVESLAADFDPSQYEDRYAAALEQLIEDKISTGRTQPVPSAEGEAEEGAGDVVDLLAALQRSVEKARGRSGGAAREQTADDEGDAPDEDSGASKPKAKGSKAGRTKGKAGTKAKEGKAGKASAASAKKPQADEEPDEAPARKTRRKAS